jgi:hypothetical protein
MSLYHLFSLPPMVMFCKTALGSQSQYICTDTEQVRDQRIPVLLLCGEHMHCPPNALIVSLCQLLIYSSLRSYCCLMNALWIEHMSYILLRLVRCFLHWIIHCFSCWVVARGWLGPPLFSHALTAAHGAVPAWSITKNCYKH